jgi:hypothetical protein
MAVRKNAIESLQAKGPYLNRMEPKSAIVFTKSRSAGVAVHASHVAVNDVFKLRQLAADERAAIRGALRGVR